MRANRSKSGNKASSLRSTPKPKSVKSSGRPWQYLFYRIRPLGKYLGMVSLGPDHSRQATSQIIPRFEATDDGAEVIPRPPTKFLSSSVVDIHSVDARKHFPTSALIFSFI